MDLDTLAEPLAYDAAFWASAFDDESYDLHELGDVALELGRKLRALGIYGLLATGERSHLVDNLARSGEYRLRYLERVPSEHRGDHHHCVLGRVEPLLDVIAAGRPDLVRALIAASPTEHDPEREYLDDHCYARILSTLYLGARSTSSDIQEDPEATRVALDETIARYEARLDGDAEPRLELCRALAEFDEAAFAEAFDMLLARRLEQIEERRSTDLDDALIIAERRVFVEGIALLNLARASSIGIDGPYALCPASALATD